METNSRIFVAGHKGLVGSAVVHNLQNKGFTNLILKTRNEMDLLDQHQVNHFFAQEKIQYVIIAAARVGGIFANQSHQADFLYENLVIATNLINAAWQNKVSKLLFLGSSCIYPKHCNQPIKESYLLSGPLEETNEGYAVAKIAGLKFCEMLNKQHGVKFISAMPTNLYGPGDNFHPQHSHVIPGMMRRFHEAKVKKEKQVSVWGDGSPRREFLHVDDLAEAIYQLMLKYENPETINIGCGEDHSIAEVAQIMKTIIAFPGDIVFDPTKPSGTPRKLLDVSKIKSLGWKAQIPLTSGLTDVYQWALESKVFDNGVAKY